MEIEQKAKELGWVPQEQFRGDPEKWVPAEEFVRRGEEVMPILRQNNKRLEDQLTQTRSELAEIKSSLKEATDAMEAFKEYANDASKRAYDKAVQDLRDQKRLALENQDHDAVIAADEALLDLRDKAPKPLEKATAPTKQEQQSQASIEANPEYLAWKADNSDWVDVDQEKMAYAASIGAYLKAMNPGLKGRAMLDKVSEEVRARFPGEKPVNRVEGGLRTGGQGSKTFESLPAEAKAACDRLAARLVGPNRAFKDLNAWRANYVKNYAWD